MSFHLRAGVQNSYSHKVRIGNWNEDQELKGVKNFFLFVSESFNSLSHNDSLFCLFVLNP